MSLFSFFAGKFLFALAALLPIINPPGLIPIFLSLTSRNTREQRQFLARRIAIYGFVLLAGSMFIGSYLLSFFGVSLPVVQLGGGLLLTFTAWRMLNDTPAEHSTHAPEPEHIDQAQLKQRAFYPLGFPLTVGLGSVSVSITIGATFFHSNHNFVQLALTPVASLLAVAVVCYLIYFCYLHAETMLHHLGPTGAVVFLRLSAFILVCLGMQIMWNGISELISGWVQSELGALPRSR